MTRQERKTMVDNYTNLMQAGVILLPTPINSKAFYLIHPKILSQTPETAQKTSSSISCSCPINSFSSIQLMGQALRNLTQTNTNFKRAGKFLTTISVNSCSKDEISFRTPSQMLKSKQNLSNHMLNSHSNKHDQYKEQNRLAYKVRSHDNKKFRDIGSLTIGSNGENKTVGVHTNDSNEGFKTHTNYTSN